MPGKTTSTPRNFPCKRQPIREMDEPVPSPVLSTPLNTSATKVTENEKFEYSRSPVSPKKHRGLDEIHASESSDDEESLDEDVDESTENRNTPAQCENIQEQPLSNNSGKHTFKFISICVAILGVLVYYLVYGDYQTNDSVYPLEKDKFPSQHEDLWLYLESGIKEVNELNRPATFLFLYKKESEQTTHELIKSISKYAVCHITECSKKPIKITGMSLNNSEFTSDYGKIITKYRNALEESGVMIVEHLEQIPGQSAQAFHSFCDQYSPLVANAVFLMSMEVEDYYDSNALEDYLQNKWKDIKVDKFAPLYARISNVILPIYHEQNL